MFVSLRVEPSAGRGEETEMGSVTGVKQIAEFIQQPQTHIQGVQGLSLGPHCVYVYVYVCVCVCVCVCVYICICVR